MDLPKELMIVDTDLDGSYASNLDCPLARALKRAGVPVDAGEGYMVSGFGEIIGGLPGKHAGLYEWEDGTQFNGSTLGTGRLVLK